MQTDPTQTDKSTTGSPYGVTVAGGNRLWKQKAGKQEPDRSAPLRFGDRRLSVPETGTMPAVAEDDGAPGSPCWVRVTSGSDSPTPSRSKRRRLSEGVIRHRLAAVGAPEHKEDSPASRAPSPDASRPVGVKGGPEAVAEETLDKGTGDRSASPAPGQQEAPWDYKVGHYDWETMKNEPVDCLTCQDQGQRWRGKRVTYYEDHVPQQHPGSRRRPCEVGGAQYL